VIVAIAGNAVENFTGIFLATKGKSDLAISVVKNSVAQIAAFLYPALVLVSLLFATSLTFSLAPVYIGALFLTAITVWQITGDGEAHMFEGFALIAIYVVLATVHALRLSVTGHRLAHHDARGLTRSAVSGSTASVASRDCERPGTKPGSGAGGGDSGEGST